MSLFRTMLFSAGTSTWAVKSLTKVCFVGLKLGQGKSSEQPQKRILQNFDSWMHPSPG